VPEDHLLETLLRAQSASGADAVSCGLRLAADQGEDTLHFFSGEPEGLGVLSNAYGNVALFRRSLLRDLIGPWPAGADADWALFAGLAVSGARVVSVPLPLVTRKGRPGSVESARGDALLVLDRIERALPGPLRSIGRLTAGLAANPPVPPANRPNGFARRTLRRLLRRGPAAASII